MKKICLVVLVLAFFLNSCEDVPEVPEKKNSINNTIEETESEEEGKAEEKNSSEEETDSEEEEEKVISSYSIKPIDEDGVLFYYFTESNILYKFKGYDKEEEQVYGIINYEDGTSEEIELTLDEFFLNKKDSTEIKMAWLVEDEYRDEEGVYHPKDYKYFTQKDGVVIQLPPRQGYLTFMSYQQEKNYGRFATDNFELKIGTFENRPVSDICNYYQSSMVRFRQIWSISEIQGEVESHKNGCYFNVIVSEIPARTEGLYFWPINKPSINYCNMKGRMYVR